MSAEPWADWIPGVLSSNQTSQLFDQGFIWRDTGPREIDPSSFDLHLGGQGYKLTRGSVKPFQSSKSYLDYLQDSSGSGAEVIEPSGDGIFPVLQFGTPYVFSIQETLHPDLLRSNIHGRATARSSVGRMDVLARLIVDGMDMYDGFAPLEKLRGVMFVEVISNTFQVRVKVGEPLSQLRLFVADPKYSLISGKDYFKIIFDGSPRADEFLSVDLDATPIAGFPSSAFCACRDIERNQSLDPIDLWGKGPGQKPDPTPYFDRISAKHDRLIIKKQDYFYLLRSKELLSVPNSIAVYARATDEALGEMRIHYAGFVHPWFGRTPNHEKKGTPLIFEVRGHATDVSLKHEEKLARLELYRMSEPAPYQKSPYGDQKLALSNFFAPFPDQVSANSLNS